MVDGGRAIVPDLAVYSVDGTTEIEAVGVKPDVRVDVSPKDYAEGRDPQLDEAIDRLMGRLKANP
jgi:tricorn protease